MSIIKLLIAAAAVISGAALLLFGLYLAYPPASYVVAGMLLLVAGVTIDVSRTSRRRTSDRDPATFTRRDGTPANVRRIDGTGR